jgi:glyoxylase-like metal-dependent hydrolase (beta-lactamase superfamily II)
MSASSGTTGRAVGVGEPYLRPVGSGCHAWVQPDGGWGLSNAGLVVGRGESLLVDTLFDLPHTQRMLDGLADLVAAAPIRTVVNTHGNGDHWFGNSLVAADHIIASTATLGDMRAVGPEHLVALLGLPGPTGDYVRSIFGDFEFEGITPVYPDQAYDGELTLDVGGVEVVLVDVGPAHSAGDTIVICERAGVVFTGDIVFAGGTPIMWNGPTSNWLAACRRIAALAEVGVETMVPGHGPVCPVTVAQDMADYLEFVHDEASRRHAAGMEAGVAARDIDLGRFTTWPESERVGVNVATIYRELDADSAPIPPGPVLFGCLADLVGHH